MLKRSETVEQTSRYFQTVVDPSHDLFYYGRMQWGLDPILSPNNVAVIGASEREGSIGRTVLWNLISSPFGGTVFPINPKRSNVLGIKAYPDVRDVPEAIDLAVVVTQARLIPNIIAACADRKIQGAIIISAGFKEIGAEGEELERRILTEARRGAMRIIGPNCLGVMRPVTGFNATFATTVAQPGKVGFISQSGALCTSVLDWSLRENVGFSAFVSVGSMLDVGWGDLIFHLGDDPHTEFILIYMETIGDARAFLSAAREVALTKPIVVIKPGRTKGAAKAAVSHTGSIAGSDEVLDAAFRRCGVLRVESIADLFHMAEVLAKQPRPKGRNLTILTNAGGPGVIATDALIAGGGQLSELSEPTMRAFDELLPPHWSRNNPVDILGDADPERYAKALDIAGKDPHSDGLLVILTPQAMTDPTRTAETLVAFAEVHDIPVLASWIGGKSIAAAETILNQASIPTFPYPDDAAKVFNYMWRFSASLRNLYDTPTVVGAPEEDPLRRQRVEQIVERAGREGRTLLTEIESKEVLAAYSIPTIPMQIATSEEEAVRVAGKIGYPVVLKLHSASITHKADVGGVQLNLYTERAVRRAFQQIRHSITHLAGPEHFLGVSVQTMVNLDGLELILGSTIDPQFGPVLLFGAGGSLVEIIADRALGLPPLNRSLARRMIEQTKIYQALEKMCRSNQAVLEALETLMVRFSHLVVEQRRIKEVDINPILATTDMLVALDARVVLHEPDVAEDQVPDLAIRPYPAEYVAPWTTKGGDDLIIRPLRPEDAPLMVSFVETLVQYEGFLRYLEASKLDSRRAHSRMARLPFIDYDREISLGAFHHDPATGEQRVFGMGRLRKLRGLNEARFAIVIADLYRGQGLGTELMSRLIEVARREKVGSLVTNMSPENTSMRRICERHGFSLLPRADSPFLRAELCLQGG
jgi:acetyltransferase